MERAAVPGAVSEEKLREWIDLYATEILKICFVWLRDRAQAEDAMQDTFIKAWRHMGDLRRKNIENEKAWLMRIAVNTCRDYRRTAWFRHVDPRVALEDLPPRMMETEDADHDLMLTVCSLPDCCRQVILLYYYHGMTEQETAEILNISLSSVHRRLRKAEALLRDALGDGEGGEEHAG